MYIVGANINIDYIQSCYKSSRQTTTSLYVHTDDDHGQTTTSLYVHTDDDHGQTTTSLCTDDDHDCSITKTVSQLSSTNSCRSMPPPTPREHHHSLLDEETQLVFHEHQPVYKQLDLSVATVGPQAMLYHNSCQ